MASASMLFRTPSQTEIVAAVVADVLAGRAVVAVRGDRGVGKTTQMRVIASKLGMQQRTVVMTSAVSASPIKLLRLIGEAVGMTDSACLSPDQLLETLQARDRPERLVLLIDDVDNLSPGMFRYLGLLIELFDLRPMKLQLVLLGPPGQWPGLQEPDLALMRQATFSRHIIYAASTLVDPPIDDPLSRLTPSLLRQHQPRSWQDRHSKWSRRASIAALGILFVTGATLTVLVNDLETPDRPANRVTERHPLVPTPVVAPPVRPAPPDTPRPAQVEEAATDPVINPAKPLQDGPSRSEEYVPPSRPGGPGLVLVAAAGDDLPNLYARVYRGLKPPPYLQVVAVNRMPLKPGTLVVFPEPPAGWPSQ